MLHFEDIKNNEEIKTYISCADASLIALGYTEHCFAHVRSEVHTSAACLRRRGIFLKHLAIPRARWSLQRSPDICTISEIL